MFGMREKLIVNRAAADDENLLRGGFVLRDKLGDVVDDEVGTFEIVARDDDVFATGELAGEAFPGAGAHDDFVT